MYSFIKLFVAFLTNIVFVCSRQNLPIELIGEIKGNEGYLALFIEGEWKYTCNELWDRSNAKVICRQLGFDKVIFSTNSSENIIEKSIKQYRYFEGRFICEGNEKSLSECKVQYFNPAVFEYHCNSDSSVYITCSNVKENVITKRADITKDPQLRLVAITNDVISGISGKLQTKENNEWNDLCINKWTDENSHVACLELGFSNFQTHELLTNRESYGKRHIDCIGNEVSLGSCYKELNRLIQCKVVNLTCRQAEAHQPFDEAGALRLRGGYRKGEGRLEVFADNIWGTICDDTWSINNADVVCRQLGFGSAIEATHWADQGQGIGKIHYTNVECYGNETKIAECKKKPNNGTCTHMEDAGVRCNIPVNKLRNEIHLTGGNALNLGRVEVLQNSKWYAICGIGFTQHEGQVVCRQLGLGFVKNAFKTYKFGVNYRKAIYNLKCHGNESNIYDCHYDTYGRCRYYDMASVICTKYAPDLVMDINTFKDSIKVESHTLRQLRCSFEERCLSPIVDQLYYVNLGLKRNLLKFTSRFLNLGAVAFIPHQEKNSWEWHKCHQHYHSMEVFAVYELIDRNGSRVASGHKASFCLEDSECDEGYKQVYNCTNKGDQGISVNCADNYKNTLDCQWIDITEVTSGNYSLSVSVNPNRDVAESDWLNNRAVCEIHYYDNKVTVKHCTTDPCYQNSYGGNAYGHCCHFPFIHNNKKYYSCIKEVDGRSWCSTTYNFTHDQKWGYCDEIV